MWLLLLSPFYKQKTDQKRLIEGFLELGNNPKPELLLTRLMGVVCIWVCLQFFHHSKSFIKDCFFSLPLVILFYYSFLTNKENRRCLFKISNWSFTNKKLDIDIYLSQWRLHQHENWAINIVQLFIVSMYSVSTSISIFLDVSVLTSRNFKEEKHFHKL